MTPIYVILPTFNRVEWLKESLASILTDPNVIVIVLNNGSSDGTREYLDGLSDARVQVHHWDKNDIAMFPWLMAQIPDDEGFACIFSDDDRMLLGGLDAKRKVLEANPEIGLVFSRVRVIHSDGQDGGVSPMGHIADWNLVGDAFDFESEICGNYIPGQSALFRVKDFRPLFHWFDWKDFGPCSDWQVWLDAAHHGIKGAYLVEPTVSLRDHVGQESARCSTSDAYTQAHLNVWRYWFGAGFKPSPGVFQKIANMACNVAFTHVCRALLPYQPEA